jgi:uncharacterized protein YceH (UPF0502 family)
MYHSSFKTFQIAGIYLFPLADVKTVNTMGFSPEMTPFTKEGRDKIHKKLRPDIQREVGELMKSTLPNRSVEYLDNRISRYSMKMGKCEITGMELSASDVHCHHYLPLNFGGSDQFNNLRIIHEDVHRLIHTKDKEMIDELKRRFQLTGGMIEKVNRFREKCKLESV